MLAQVKKLAGDDFTGRFAAWWNGRDYAAPAPEGEEGEKPDAPKIAAPKADKKAEAPVEKQPEADPVHEEIFEASDETAAAKSERADLRAGMSSGSIGGAAIRIRALETLWGEGRFSPGSFALDTKIIDTLLELADQEGDIGFVGVDGALLNAFAAQSDRKALATEWRAACVERLHELVPSAEVTAGEVDRPRGFADSSLPAVASVEAFAYSDHKAGLVGRVFRALDAKGRWVFLDTTRTTKKTPSEAFASAWAEPQLATNDEIDELLKLAGFKTVQKVPVTELVLASARQGFANLAQVLESAAQNGFTGRDGALFLQELAWEAQSWRARTRALEGGALEMNLWVADKTEQLPRLELSEDMLVQEIRPDDAGAADALFENAQ
jgi:hypothetical protein